MILAFDMKKTLSIMALVLAVSASHAATVLQPDFDYNGYWVYVWTGSEGGQWTDDHWSILQSSGQSSLNPGTGYKPVNGDPGFIGYDFSIQDGKQTFTSSQNPITVTGGGDLLGYTGHMYLGDNVTLNASSYGDYSTFTMHLGANAKANFGFDMGIAAGTVFDFGLMTGNSLVTIGTAWMKGSTILQGSYTMTGLTASIDMFKIGFGAGSLSDFDGSQLNVTDADGNKLAYSQDASNLKDGEFGLQYNDGNIQLVAKGGVPEPTSVSLGILGLGALMMRRRRA